MKNFALSWPKAASKVAQESVLVLTSTGGSGHLQASQAKRKEIEQTDPHAKVYVEDIMNDWLGQSAGNFFSRKWNRAQRDGNLLKLALYCYGQTFADWLICIPVFISALRFLSMHDITRVIDTQNMGMSSLLKAIRLIRFLTGREISYEKVITDLPSASATHFFTPIKRLSKKDRALLNLVTVRPMVGEESEQAFWKRTCKLSIDKVRYEPLPVRPAFRKANLADPTVKTELSFSINHTNEPDLLKRAFAKGSVEAKFSKGTFSLTLNPEDKVCVLMLGANPHQQAFLDYVKQFILQVRKNHTPHRKDHLFLFCNEYTEKTTSLMEKVVRLIETIEDYPSSLTIIPLSYQSDDQIAPLFHRSDATITRSGGLTSMEILTACHGKIWIHKGSYPDYYPKVLRRLKTLKYGMPVWEKGNAQYLSAKKGAEMISPESFMTVSSSYFEK